jgi:hypothetical protein
MEREAETLKNVDTSISGAATNDLTVNGSIDKYWPSSFNRSGSAAARQRRPLQPVVWHYSPLEK